MKIIFILITLLVTTSCSDSNKAIPENELRISDGRYTLKARVEEYALKDGTRCAVLIGSGKGGISCDWK